MPLLLLSKSQPLTLGCDLVLGANPEAVASILLRYSKSPRTTYRSRRFFSKVTSHSFCRSSSPNRTRYAGLRFSLGSKPESRGIYTVAMFHAATGFVALVPNFLICIQCISLCLICPAFPNEKEICFFQSRKKERHAFRMSLFFCLWRKLICKTPRARQRGAGKYTFALQRRNGSHTSKASLINKHIMRCSAYSAHSPETVSGHKQYDFCHNSP